MCCQARLSSNPRAQFNQIQPRAPTSSSSHWQTFRISVITVIRYWTSKSERASEIIPWYQTHKIEDPSNLKGILTRDQSQYISRDRTCQWFQQTSRSFGTEVVFRERSLAARSMLRQNNGFFSLRTTYGSIQKKKDSRMDNVAAS